jgi:LPXTG-motif cell wall-anchored protein
MDLQVIEMGFGKVAIMFIFLAMFAFVMIGMFAMMQRDAPTDSYYDNATNSVKGTIGLAKVIQGQTGSLMVPILAIAGILMLAAAFAVLRKG